MTGPERFLAFLLRWHGVWRHRAGQGGLRRTVEQLQGVPLPVSDLENAVLPARLGNAAGQGVDEMLKSGEAVWQGEQRLGRRDGYISLFLKDSFPRLGRISTFAPGVREASLRQILLADEAPDFEQIAARLGGFPDELLRSLWKLVWQGEVTSDSLDALRARRSSGAGRYHRRPRPRYATRKPIPPGASGRWKLLSGPSTGFAPEPDRRLALAERILDRYGVLCAETFPGLDDWRALLDQLVDAGKALRGHLPDTAAGAQFLAPGAEAVWLASGHDAPQVVLAACDPANPFGELLPWPALVSGLRPQRSPGARVLIGSGRLLAYLPAKGRSLHTPRDLKAAAPVIRLLKQAAGGAPVYLESINGEPPYRTPWHADLVAAGFSPSRRGYLLRAGSR